MGESKHTTTYFDDIGIPEVPTTGEKKSLDAYYLDYGMTAGGLIIIGICWFLGFNTHQNAVFYNIMLLIGSLSLLLGASDIVLEYAVKISEFLGVSEMVIGLTIVSLGTSIPEMFTAIASAKEGIGAFVVGDIYGSYITQLSLFLGIVILFDPKTVSKDFVPHIKRDGILMLLAILFLTMNISDGKLTRAEAYLGLGLYAAYIIFLYIRAKKNPEEANHETKYEENLMELERIYTKDELAQKEIKKVVEKPEVTELERDLAWAIQQIIKPKWVKIVIYLVMVFAGTFLCYIGATNVVRSGSNLAYMLDVSPQVVAATIVGFGTGFPEFVVSVMAIRRKKLDIAYGNLLGSNIVDPLVSISLGILTQEIALSAADLSHIFLGLLPIAIAIDFFIILSFSRKDCTKKRGLITGGILILIYMIFMLSSFLIHG
jgi:cation:H+ antiporter